MTYDVNFGEFVKPRATKLKKSNLILNFYSSIDFKKLKKQRIYLYFTFNFLGEN